MKKLTKDYTVEVDNVDKDTWHDLLLNFDDGVYVQTWSYGAIRWGEKNLSHLILKKDGKVVAIAQARIVKLPILRDGIAYIPSGPIWKIHGEEENLENLRYIIRALREEYVIRRGLALRILPKEIEGEDDNISKIFKGEGFSWKQSQFLTILMDLSPSLEELRKNLRKSWKRSLKDAEQERLELVESSGDELNEIALRMHKEMVDRKKYVEFVDADEMVSINKDLPEALKLRIMIAKYENEPVAALGWFTHGTTGLGLISGTGNKALKLKVSFLLWWRMIEYYKKNGFSRFDFGGINPEKNPGGYFFKSGLAGKSGREVRYLGQFDACENYMSFITFKIGDLLRLNYRKTKERLLLPRVPRNRDPESRAIGIYNTR